MTAADGRVPPPAGAAAAPERTRVKICGLCRPADAQAAARAGADYLGFVFAPSPRRVSPALAPALDQALGPAGPARVGVFMLPTPGPAGGEEKGARATAATVREMAELARAFRLDYLQLHGPLSASLTAALRAEVRLPWILALRAGEDDPRPALAAAPYALLFDTPHPRGGGSGEPFDWTLAEPWRAATRLFLAGGLTSSNVRSAIDRVRPFAVDVATGVETAPGVKSTEAIADFVAAVRAADRARRPAPERA